MHQLKENIHHRQCYCRLKSKVNLKTEDLRTKEVLSCSFKEDIVESELSDMM